MDKDLSLIKRILEAVKEHEGPEELGLSQEALGLQDVDKRVYAFHLKMLYKEGYLLAEDITGIADEYPMYEPYQLTESGNSLLYDLSVKGNIAKVLKHFAGALEKVSIQLIAEYLKRLTMP